MSPPTYAPRGGTIYVYIMQVRLHRNIAASSLAADCNVPQRPPAIKRHLYRWYTHTTLSHTHTRITRNKLEHTNFHTQLFHAQPFTHNSFTRKLPHTTLLHMAFHAKLFYTQLFHTLPFTHDSFTYNIVTHNRSLSHTALSHTTLSHTALSHPVLSHNLSSPSHFHTCFELVARSWHVGLSGPLILFIAFLNRVDMRIPTVPWLSNMDRPALTSSFSHWDTLGLMVSIRVWKLVGPCKSRSDIRISSFLRNMSLYTSYISRSKLYWLLFRSSSKRFAASLGNFLPTEARGYQKVFKSQNEHDDVIWCLHKWTCKANATCKKKQLKD